MELTFRRAKSGQEIVTVATRGIFKKKTNVHRIKSKKKRKLNFAECTATIYDK